MLYFDIVHYMQHVLRLTIKKPTNGAYKACLLRIIFLLHVSAIDHCPQGVTRESCLV